MIHYQINGHNKNAHARIHLKVLWFILGLVCIKSLVVCERWRVAFQPLINLPLRSMLINAYLI